VVSASDNLKIAAGLGLMGLQLSWNLRAADEAVLNKVQKKIQKNPA
jgi:hypothetical protein